MFNLMIARKRKKLTQEQLAKILKVDRITISRWERGEARPNIDKLKKLGEILEVTTDNLLEE